MSLSRRDLLRAALAGSALPAVPAMAMSGNVVMDCLANSELDSLRSVAQFREAARKKLPPDIFAYIDGYAGDGITKRRNEKAFNRIAIMPRGLSGISKPDTTTEILGNSLTAPLILGPTGLNCLIHPEGARAVGWGSWKSRLPMVMSMLSCNRIEDITRPFLGEDCGVWFQLYLPRDRDFTKTILERVAAAGCKAICLTVDSGTSSQWYLSGRRIPDLPRWLDLPMVNDAKRWLRDQPLESFYHNIFKHDATWDDLSWLVSQTHLPVFCKGVMNPKDASRAMECGAAGIIVSNHGGRNLDGAPATIDVLPAIRNAVGEHVPVLIDGGVRHGTDILKAIALGADAAMIGRPYLYGLAVSGAVGVSCIAMLLVQELEDAMIQTGCANIAAINRDVIYTKPGTGEVIHPGLALV